MSGWIRDKQSIELKPQGWWSKASSAGWIRDREQVDLGFNRSGLCGYTCSCTGSSARGSACSIARVCAGRSIGNYTGRLGDSGARRSACRSADSGARGAGRSAGRSDGGTHSAGYRARRGADRCARSCTGSGARDNAGSNARGSAGATSAVPGGHCVRGGDSRDRWRQPQRWRQRRALTGLIA